MKNIFNGYEAIYIHIRNIHYMYYTYNIKPGISPKEMMIYVHTKTCTQIFKTALYIIAQIGNNPSVFQ